MGLDNALFCTSVEASCVSFLSGTGFWAVNWTRTAALLRGSAAARPIAGCGACFSTEAETAENALLSAVASSCAGPSCGVADAAGGAASLAGWIVCGAASISCIATGPHGRCDHQYTPEYTSIMTVTKTGSREDQSKPPSRAGCHSFSR